MVADLRHVVFLLLPLKKCGNAKTRMDDKVDFDDLKMFFAFSHFGDAKKRHDVNQPPYTPIKRSKSQITNKMSI
jgi:hypothetical protein